MKNGTVAALLLSISFLAAPSFAQDNGSVGSHSSSHIQKDEEGHPKKVIEDRVAGLRPGRDTIAKAYGRFHKDRVFEALSTPDSAVWTDSCNREVLTVAFDTKGTIREVKAERQYLGEADCELRAYTRSARARLGGTGHGLVLRDSCNRIQYIYGAPHYQRHSTRDDEEFVYRFDRPVKGFAYSLELTCDSVRNEVKTIKLTASSPPKP